MKNVLFVLSEYIVKSQYVSIVMGIVFILPGVVFSQSSGMSCSDSPERFSPDWYSRLFIIGMNLTEALGVLLFVNGLFRKNTNLSYVNLATKPSKSPGLPKQTSTFWICFAIIVSSLIIGGSYYLINKDNGRYKVDGALIIDTKTGTAKQISFE